MRQAKPFRFSSILTSAFDKKNRLPVTALAVAVLAPVMAVAQVSIQGTIKSDEGEVVSFAHVVLRQAGDSALVDGTMTAADGAFSLSADPGDYLLSVSVVGYRPEHFRVQAGPTQDVVHVGDLYLKEEVTELNAVEVTAMRPMVEKLSDRTIVNVSNSIAGTGMSALAILERSPGIVVNRQSGTVSLNGRTGVQIMINGKPSRMPPEAVLQMLDGVNSAGIDKIELITTPPARYEAEGNAGIINIVTATSADEGTHWNIAAGAGIARRETLFGNLNMNHRKGPFSTFVGYSWDRTRNVHYWLSDYSVTSEGVAISNASDSRRTPLTTVQNLNLGAEYQFSKRTSATLLLTGYRRNWDMDALTVNTYRRGDDPLVNTEMAVWEMNLWQSAATSIGVHHRLNESQDISFSFDYLRYDNDNPSSYHNTVDQDVNDIILVDKVTPINFRVGSFDYTNALRTGLKLEAGGKVTLSRFTNTVRVDRPVTEETDLNTATLDEEILAAYASVQWEPAPDWQIHGGLRYEHTDSYLASPSDGVLVDRSFGNLFPDLTIVRALSATKKVQVAYSRRITRPTFNDMAPFVFYIGPSTFVSGNLSLRPAVADAVEASLQVGDIWLAVRYNDASNEIAQFQPSYQEETGELVIRSENMTSSRSLGASVSMPWRPFSWWEAQVDASVYRQWYETDYLGINLRQDISRVELSMTNVFLLPSDFSIELSGTYQSAMPLGVSNFQSRSQLNLGMKKEMGNSVVALTYSDMSEGMQWRITTDVPEVNFRSYTRYDWGTRLIKFTYSYTFGNRKLRKVDVRSGSEDERKRVQ